jgi:O-methyltransferase involved in polyketide biosynthesis
MGVRQYVILGSGLDTFAFRNAHLDGIILSKKVAEHGKPWKTFYDPDSMIQMLHSLGFSKMEDFGPEVLNRYYLEGRTDGLKKSGTSHLIRAEK